MVKKILVVNVNWLGDVILSTPVFKALKKQFPLAEVTCLAVPRVKEILESCPGVDRIILCDEDGKRHGPIEKFRLWWQLRQQRFDLAFLLHRSWSRALLVYLSGAKERVGYDTKKRGIFLTQRIDPLEGTVHRRDHYLQVIEGYGVPVDDRLCELKVDPAAKASVEQILAKQGIAAHEKFIVVNAGANWDLKRWPRENWALLLRRLAAEFNCRLVIPGAAKDMDLAQAIAQASGVRPVILAGKTNLKELIALLSKAVLVVTADSGPMHMASAVGTTVLAVFGPTRPEITGPVGKGQSVILQKDVTCNRTPCYNLTCPDNVCMKAVTVDDVVMAVKDLLESDSRRE